MTVLTISGCGMRPGRSSGGIRTGWSCTDHSRRIWAYPRFDVPPDTLLAEDDPSRLDAQMSEIEMTYLRRMP